MDNEKLYDSNLQNIYSCIISDKSLLNDIIHKNVNAKTPVTLLQEISTKAQIEIPVYKLVNVEGLSHEPLFEYEVKIGEGVTAIGKGNSKRKAKHSAALAVLSRLSNSFGENDKLHQELEILLKKMQEANLDESKLESKSDQNDTLVDSIEDKTQNPVGELLEVTTKLSIRPPIFEYGDEEGPPHNKIFVCYVKFKLPNNIIEYKETGRGRSKRNAKRQAALKLLLLLKGNLQLTRGREQNSSTDSLNVPLINKEKNSKKDSNFFTNLKSSTKPTLLSLYSYDSTYEHDFQYNTALLEKLSKEENFDYSTYQVKKKNSEPFRILLQIKSNYSYGGVGNTIGEALNQAIYNFILAVCIHLRETEKIKIPTK